MSHLAPENSPQRLGEVTRVRVSEGELACYLAGHGPPAVFLHPPVMDSRLWQPQVADLTARCQTICIDQRGHGASPIPDLPYDPAADVRQVLSDFDLGRVTLIGLGEGADYALQVAISEPARVSAVVLATPMIGWLESGADAARFHAIASEGLNTVLTDPDMQPLVDAVAAGNLSSLADMIGNDTALLSRDNPLRSVVAAMAQTNVDTLFRVELVQPPRQELFDQLSGVSAPVLVISPDTEASRNSAAILADHLPTVTEVTLRTTAILVNLELPSAFNAAVLEFMQRR